MAKFSERLNEALVRRGMRPSDLARATGIGEGAISQYRKGAYKATQINLEKMAHALNVSIPWLMGVDDAISEKPKTETPTVGEDDGISDVKRALYAYVDSITEEQAALVLKILKSIVETE